MLENNLMKDNLLGKLAVQTAERRYQQRLEGSGPESRRGPQFWRLLSITFYLLSVFSILALIAIEFTDAVFGLDINMLNPTPFTRFVQAILLYVLPFYVLLPTTAVFYLRLVIRTLSLSMDSIVREKRTGSWEVLKLSNIRATDLVYGKVRATFQTVAADYLLLAVLRIGLVIWLGGTRLRVDMGNFPLFDLYPYYLEYPIRMRYMLFSMVVVLGMTLLGGVLTTACGVLMGVILNRTHIWAAWLLRTGLLTLLIVVCAISFFLAFFSYNDESDDPFPVGVLSITIGISLVDNGLIANAFLFSDANIHPVDHLFYYVGLLVVSAIYAGLSRLLLWRAIGILEHQGM